MLEEFGWIGKLPNYSDFVQSNHLKSVQKALMRWLTNGQDHIGEQLVDINRKSEQIYIYYFFIESYISDHKRIHGLFFTSRDSQGRKCPFIIFTHKHTMDPIAVLSDFRFKLNQLGFQWNMLSDQIPENFYENVKEPLLQISSSAEFSENEDSWYELYPNFFDLNFRIESTNHVIFRKLLIR